jgi:hypothetical protein
LPIKVQRLEFFRLSWFHNKASCCTPALRSALARSFSFDLLNHPDRLRRPPLRGRGIYDNPNSYLTYGYDDAGEKIFIPTQERLDFGEII